MATLSERIVAVVERIRDQFNAIRPRLMPLGGAAGAVLTKSAAADNAVSWSRPPHGFSLSIGGKPVAGEKVGPWIADRDFTIPDAFGSSNSNSGTAADKLAVFTVLRNGASIGTLTYTAGSTLGVFATNTAADVVVAKNDRFFLACPDPQDATLADLGVNIIGYR